MPAYVENSAVATGLEKVSFHSTPKLYTEYRQNAGLDVAQAGIKIAGRNINNLRYADMTPSLWQKVKKN